MWIRAATLFEVFCEKKSLKLGFRLRVNSSMAIKVTLREEEGSTLAGVPLHQHQVPAHIFMTGAQ